MWTSGAVRQRRVSRASWCWQYVHTALAVILLKKRVNHDSCSRSFFLSIEVLEVPNGYVHMRLLAVRLVQFLCNFRFQLTFKSRFQSYTTSTTMIVYFFQPIINFLNTVYRIRCVIGGFVWCHSFSIFYSWWLSDFICIAEPQTTFVRREMRRVTVASLHLCNCEGQQPVTASRDIRQTGISPGQLRYAYSSPNLEKSTLNSLNFMDHTA